jgi:serine/threonine-protein kinase HipA
VKLDVHVKGKKVAQLFRDRDEYLLAYTADAGPEDFVSLTMPVREEPWAWPRDLHPFFRQNLPEGYLLFVIREEFGRLLDGTDLSLLAVIGGAGIGRVTVTPEGAEPGGLLEPIKIEELLTGNNTAEHFAGLVRKYARAAISGVVPKFIAPERLARDEEALALGKPTIRTSRYIVKGSDDNTPYLGFNEFYAMRVLEQLQVAPVAKTQMSEDGRVLIVERFDVDASGIPVYGVEDLCGLLGLPPQEKYRPSMEQVIRAAKAYLPSATARQQLEQIGWLLLSNFVVRNADCHAKNIALYYSSLADVAFAPAFDIVTTQAYPRYAENPPGLTIEGRKTWAPGKSIEQFFRGRLDIPARQYKAMVERLCDSAVQVGHEIIEAARNEPRWHGVAKQMLHAWNEGMASLRHPQASRDYKDLTPAILAAGFSDPDPPDRSGRVVGRSELLAKPHKG